MGIQRFEKWKLSSRWFCVEIGPSIFLLEFSPQIICCGPSKKGFLHFQRSVFPPFEKCPFILSLARPLICPGGPWDAKRWKGRKKIRPDNDRVLWRRSEMTHSLCAKGRIKVYVLHDPIPFHSSLVWQHSRATLKATTRSYLDWDVLDCCGLFYSPAMQSSVSKSHSLLSLPGAIWSGFD